MDKSEIKEKIIKIIENADGNIKTDEIYELLEKNVDPGRTQETIRTYVRELVNDGSVLIGSSQKGYFKIKSRKEAKQAIEYLQNRIPKLEERINELRKSWNSQNPNDKI
ncbi:MAG: hypothetical protein JXR26_11955 [Balneolaceae bacterium]|nr:hypothetical protein [Balneolaceae bacterium]